MIHSCIYLVINLFIAKAIKENKITVFGGNQYRPFLHVEDAADSLVFAVEKNLTGTYNIVSENMTILEAAKKISELTNCEIEISEENEDKRDYKVSSEKMSHFGFIPKKDIKLAYEQIKKVIEDGTINDFTEKKYNNYELLCSSEEMRKKVFIQGI